MKTLEMKISKLLEQTTKARLFSAITQIGAVYSGNHRYQDRKREVERLHERLLDCIRAPFLVRHSLQDILDMIEDTLPVDDQMDIAWIMEDTSSIPDFVFTVIPARLSSTSK